MATDKSVEASSTKPKPKLKPTESSSKIKVDGKKKSNGEGGLQSFFSKK